MTQQPSSPIRGWTVVIAAISINLILGVLYAWSVMGKALVLQWHWKAAQASLPFTISTASFALMMIFAGRWQDKIGPRYVAMLGGIILGLGLIASSFAKTPEMMLITFGLIGGMGIGLGYSATTPPSIKWFPPAKKGLITGLVVSGVGLAAVYIAPLTQYLLQVTSFRTPSLFLASGRSSWFRFCPNSWRILRQATLRLARAPREPPRLKRRLRARIWTGTKCYARGSSTISG